MSTRTFAVEGMSCEHCVNAVTGEVTKVPGVTNVVVDLAGKTVTVSGAAVDDAAVRAAIDEAGYTVAS
jgi:copper chaperone